MKKPAKAYLALEDGTIFEGISFGAHGEKTGEVVFNTSMSGYQEIITDPSYKGQIVCLTYPLIGNYGINSEDSESQKLHIEGLVIKECSRIFSNFRGQISLPDFLKKNNIIGIEGIDTRALTRRIRLAGSMKAVLSTKTSNKKELIQKAKKSPGLIGRDLVREVTCKEPYSYPGKKGKTKIVVIDCGVKSNILNSLSSYDCEVIVVPADSNREKILGYKPDGILISNGPGDPASLTYLISTVRELIKEKIPIFGICLGHQILGLALGGKTYKLKFGHHGGNHPVKHLETGKIDITAQNHGFCVDISTLNKEEIEMTYINLYDGTAEGMKHKKLPIFSVQYHPESSPGPHDSKYLFDEFINMITRIKK